MFQIIKKKKKKSGYGDGIIHLIKNVNNRNVKKVVNENAIEGYYENGYIRRIYIIDNANREK